MFAWGYLCDRIVMRWENWEEEEEESKTENPVLEPTLKKKKRTILFEPPAPAA